MANLDKIIIHGVTDHYEKALVLTMEVFEKDRITNSGPASKEKNKQPIL